jgi:hypothetical protein
LLLPDAIKEFKQTVAKDTIRVENLPPLILVFGGPVGVNKSRDISCRNLFLDVANTLNYQHVKHFKIPEDYPEWNQFEGYKNLVDFEIEAGCLSRAIVLFSEGPGAFAELGAFCMDAVLRERLFVVIEKRHYNDESFISLGPIKRIEDNFPDHAICVVETMDPPSEFEAHINDVLAALSEKLESGHKSQSFDSHRTRDQYLLVADLIDLFCVLTITEIHDLLAHMDINIEFSRVKAILKQLILFELIFEVQITTRRFFVANKQEKSYLNYEAIKGEKNFERLRFKMKVYESLPKDHLRNNAFQTIHGKK